MCVLYLLLVYHDTRTILLWLFLFSGSCVVWCVYYIYYWYTMILVPYCSGCSYLAGVVWCGVCIIFTIGIPWYHIALVVLVVISGWNAVLAGGSVSAGEAANTTRYIVQYIRLPQQIIYGYIPAINQLAAICLTLRHYCSDESIINDWWYLTAIKSSALTLFYFF